MDIQCLKYWENRSWIYGVLLSNGLIYRDGHTAVWLLSHSDYGLWTMVLITRTLVIISMWTYTWLSVMNYSRYVMKGLYGSEFVVMKIELRLNHFFPDAFSISKMIFTTQFHQPRLVIRTFHRQGRRSRGTRAVINKIRPLIFSYVFVSINYMNASWYWWDCVYDFFAAIKEIWSQNFSI